MHASAVIRVVLVGERRHAHGASADPSDPPRILFNYMSEPQDWADFRHCIRLTREIFAQPAFEPYRGREIAPGDAAQSDDELDAFVRGHVESAYHPCGTCRMGRRDDPTAVVDPECRVIGIEGLRVADSSVFPRITNGNTNAPAIMVGEKASDHILGRAPCRAPTVNPGSTRAGATRTGDASARRARSMAEHRPRPA